jgi:hypothetical protein
MSRTVAFIFGCSVYCPRCAERFDGRLDSEGEGPRPIYDFEEWNADSPEGCSQCGDLLDLSLSRAGAAALLADLREKKESGEWYPGRGFYLDAMRLHRWQLKHAGLTEDEREDLETELEKS